MVSLSGQFVGSKTELTILSIRLASSWNILISLFIAILVHMHAPFLLLVFKLVLPRVLELAHAFLALDVDRGGQSTGEVVLVDHRGGFGRSAAGAILLLRHAAASLLAPHRAWSCRVVLCRYQPTDKLQAGSELSGQILGSVPIPANLWVKFPMCDAGQVHDRGRGMLAMPKVPLAHA